MSQLTPPSSRHAEWMDDPLADPETLAKSLGFIRRINVALGYTRATLHHLKRFSQSWDRSRRIDILDVGTGSADIPLAILRWAETVGWNLRIVAIDRHPQTIRIAAEAAAREPRLHFVQADALQLPFAPGSFDYVISAMFLHHLDKAQASAVLGSMNCLARRGIVVSDILRNRRAMAWTRILSAFSNPMVRHDAVLSVAQAFTRRDLADLQHSAGLDYTRCFYHFAHRFVLAGQKSPSD